MMRAFYPPIDAGNVRSEPSLVTRRN